MGKINQIRNDLDNLMLRMSKLERVPLVSRSTMLESMRAKYKALEREYERLGNIAIWKITSSEGTVVLGDLSKTDAILLFEQVFPSAIVEEIEIIPTKVFLEKI
jgi:hypothetical protein